MKAVMMEKSLRGHVHCPICTHTVPANVDFSGRKPRVVPGQRCPRCSATLDVAVVLRVAQAA
jgi:hypothetical protein